MLGAASDRGIPLVMLNTNGIRLARDPRFAPALAEIGVHVYLQFDGPEAATQLAIRGRDLTDEKLRALDRCAEAGLSVSLAAAVERGVNEARGRARSSASESSIRPSPASSSSRSPTPGVSAPTPTRSTSSPTPT